MMFKECFLSVVVLRGVVGQNCGTYQPGLTDVPDVENYVSGNFTLFCAYTADSPTYVYWLFKVTDLGNYQNVYEVDLVDGSSTVTNLDYEDYVIGEFVDTNNNSLTVINARWMFTESTWICNLATTQCGFGEDSYEVAKSLKSKYK